MKEFIKRSNKTLHSNEEPVIKAARISHDFVSIHPFPDFNGRISRLIMNMVLLHEGLPFMVAIRGDKRGKHKYIYALKRANRGKIDAYACLIAKAVNDAFDQINRNLKLAGIDPIVHL
jgi:Fic family protein